MMLRAQVFVAVMLAAMPVAMADPPKMLVLQSEGSAPADVRARVDAALVRLAVSAGLIATHADISFSDAALLVGCDPEAPSCRDDVIASQAVDEIVITQVTARATGFDVRVRRAGRGRMIHEAYFHVPQRSGDGIDKLVGIGPMFSTTQPDPARPEPVPGGPPPTPGSAPGATLAPGQSEPGSSAQITAPLSGSEPATPPERGRWPLYGVMGGGAMILTGLVLWSSALGVEGDIEDLRVQSGRDLEQLRDLETKGDSYARWGNVFMIGGIGLASVSTYYFFKHRRERSSATARVMPMILEGGGGIALSFGAVP